MISPIDCEDGRQKLYVKLDPNHHPLPDLDPSSIYLRYGLERTDPESYYPIYKLVHRWNKMEVFGMVGWMLLSGDARVLDTKVHPSPWNQNEVA